MEGMEASTKTMIIAKISKEIKRRHKAVLETDLIWKDFQEVFPGLGNLYLLRCIGSIWFIHAFITVGKMHLLTLSFFYLCSCQMYLLNHVLY